MNEERSDQTTRDKTDAACITESLKKELQFKYQAKIEANEEQDQSKISRKF
ncbi:hypothetical protein V498_10013, partial [Pseudogymnoascus sp. VKM F-4517 (FW-2822)]